MLNTVSRQVLVTLMATSTIAAAPVAASAAEQQAAVEEIVVTAQRREESLQEVPISVSAVTGNALERAGVTETRQLTQSMPSVVFSRANGAFQPYIRGVGTRNANIGDESSVSVYVDGIYQPSMNSLGFDLVNISRVEVLRGPQGTLFGRNATGGLVNIITPDPEPTFSGRAVLRAGNFGEYSAGIYLTGPIVDGLAWDINYQRYGDDGYLKDLVRGGRAGARETEAFRGKLLFQPNDTFRAVVAASVFDVSDQSLSNQPVNGNTIANTFIPIPVYGREPWETGLENLLLASARTKSLSLQTRYAFSAATLETSSSLQKGESHSRTDNDASSRVIQNSETFQENAYISNEVRLLSTSEGPVSWILGGYQFSGRGEFRPLISYTNGVRGVPVYTRQDVDSLAAFGEGTYRLGDHVKLIAGIRYTKEDREYSSRNTTTVLVPLQKGSQDKITYRFVAQYAFNEDTNVYASYSRGFKSGVFNGFATTLPAARMTRPETLDSIELGVKSDPLPWLRVNGSVFWYDYTDIQQSARDPNLSLVVLFNAAKSKTKGAEIEVTTQPLDGLSVRGYATYLDATYQSFPGAQIFQPRTPTTANPCRAGIAFCGNNTNSNYDASGKDMIRSPKFTAGMSFDYSRETELGVFAIAGNVFYSAKYYWDFENRLANPAYTMVNGEVSWAQSSDEKALRLSIWGRNLGNEVVYSQILTSAQGDVGAFERPRSYGVGLSKRF